MVKTTKNQGIPCPSIVTISHCGAYTEICYKTENYDVTHFKYVSYSPMDDTQSFKLNK